MKDEPHTHIWCPDCGTIVKLILTYDIANDTSGKYIGKDLICENRHVVAAVFKEDV